MNRNAIDPRDFCARPHRLWSEQWFLLTAGDFASSRYNSMTVAWGSFGTMWSKPFALIVVRPTRFTYEFMEQYTSFTLSAFPAAHRDALAMMGSKSGRDVDKIKASGLTPVASSVVAAPGFEQAELVVECRKMYWSDIDPQHFVDDGIASNYPKHDYHRMYFGEIVAVSGTSDYRCGA